MKLRSGSRAEPEINLTSLIDVVLLLLVFFMITTSFVRESELAIRLPEAASEAAPDAEQGNLEITITARGTYLVNGRGLIDSRPETLRAAILKVREDVNAGRVTISADANASHQSVVTAMDVAGRLGFTEVSIATVNVQEQAR